jgi:hypothetical protein
MFFMFITAFVLAEICSALPLSGSIYIWAAESAGPKYARFFGFLVAWWSTTAWMTFTAGNCQVCDSLLNQVYLSDGETRPLRITSCPNLPFGESTFPVASATIALNGGRSSGLSPRPCYSCRLRSITSRQDYTRACSGSRSSSSCSTFYSASSGFPLPFTTPTGSVLQRMSSLYDVRMLHISRIAYAHQQMKDNGTGAPAGWNWILSL